MKLLVIVGGHGAVEALGGDGLGGGLCALRRARAGDVAGVPLDGVVQGAVWQAVRIKLGLVMCLRLRLHPLRRLLQVRSCVGKGNLTLLSFGVCNVQ